MVQALGLLTIFAIFGAGVYWLIRNVRVGTKAYVYEKDSDGNEVVVEVTPRN